MPVGRRYSVKVFPVKVAEDAGVPTLPPEDQLDALLATELHCISACNSSRLYATEASVTEPAPQAIIERSCLL